MKRSKAVGKFGPEVGKAYFVRCITHHYCGRLAGFAVIAGRSFLVLVDASWVADDGPFAAAIATGILNEVEPYPDGQPVYVLAEAISDFTEWKHALPRERK